MVRSIPDLLSDRSKQRKLMVLGLVHPVTIMFWHDVKVGKCSDWPKCILDGSGGLEIGDFVSVSAGVQIYSHNTVSWSTSLGFENISKKPTKIGNGVYLGPNSVIQMGVTIGDQAVVGAMSFVNKDIPFKGKWYGNALIE